MDPAEVSKKPAFLGRIGTILAGIPDRRAARTFLVAFVIGLFVIGNVPWHLDNYDQAKQAYVAFEISKTGSWLYQHTPKGRQASKPPLMGWLSMPVYFATGSWEIALRLPAFLCAVAMLCILMREGAALLPGAGGLVAAAAFGLNLLSPRLATLVRTDMMLSFFIFLVGWSVYRKISMGTPWTARERWGVFVFMVAALFTKGPVIYAFLLPGIIVFALFAPQKDRRLLVWSGWWTWLIPLALFLLWGFYALQQFDDFKKDVVDREFLTRFREGARDDERPQPTLFYFPHILHKFGPWSLLILALGSLFHPVRKRLREDAATFWLLVWSLGGLMVMTFVPAKRVDRIFPIIPPLCLLLVSMLVPVWSDKRVRLTVGACVSAAVLFAGGYFIGLVPLSYAEGSDKLVKFSKQARAVAKAQGVAGVAVLGARDEGLLLYLDQLSFARKGDVFARWENGEPLAFVTSEESAQKFLERFPNAKPALDSGPLRFKNSKRYLLFVQGGPSSQEAP